MGFYRKALVGLVIVALLGGVTGSFAAKSATEDLKVALDSIISLLSNKKADPVKRRAEVVGRIRSEFDFYAMSRFILGPNWASASPEEQKRFVELYAKILEDTYIERIEAYTDEKVKFIGEKAKGDKVAVETVVVSGNKEIPIEYRLFQEKGKEKWRVYDVSIEGVSLVRNFQDSYKAVLRKEGMKGLLAQMDTKVRELEGGK